MKKHHYFLILTFFFFFLGVLLLNVPHSVGLADNTDFIRVSQPVGLALNSDYKFFYFQQRFEYIKPFYNLKDFFKFVLSPDIENISGFQTTQFLFITIAQLIDGIVAYLSNQVITYFNITILSLNFLVIHSISAALCLDNTKVSSLHGKFFMRQTISTSSLQRTLWKTMLFPWITIATGLNRI